MLYPFPYISVKMEKGTFHLNILICIPYSIYRTYFKID